jgi:hypothetical protein
MPSLTIDLIQMGIVAVILVASSVIFILRLFAANKSLILVAGRCLNLWSGGVILLLCLEAIEAAMGSS